MIAVRPSIALRIASCTCCSTSASSDAHDGARNRDALALSARERHAALADLGVEALRQRRDEVVDSRNLRRTHKVVARRALEAVADVVG